MSNSARKVLLPFIFLITSFVIALGQGAVPQQTLDEVNKLMPRPVPPSPDVASLGKYGEYPVGHYTGIPNISIPLYEVVSGELRIPITLNYHASGFRVADQSGWIGFGWSLSAGGQISRATYGIEDEDYFTTHDLVDTLSNCNTYTFLRDVDLGSKDSQADVYSYSIPGKSGNFTMGPNGEVPYLFPYENIKFQAYDPSEKFELTDDKGVLYRFGKNSQGATAYQSSSSHGGGIQKTSRTAWQLMQMFAPNSDDSISISYQSPGPSHSFDRSYSYTITSPCDPFGNPSTPCDVTADYELWTNLSSTDLNPHEILFEGGKVEFVLDTAERKDMSETYALKFVRIYSLVNGDYKPVKSYELAHSYFVNAEADTIEERLRLDRVILRDSSDNVEGSYRFTYFTNTLHESFEAIDYWGFYNGKPNTSSIPYQTVTINNQQVQIGGADRSTDTTYMKDAVLKRIDYPTCGYTDFDFETNRYLDGGVVKYAGGLRVKRIISHTRCESPPVTKTYKYGVGESGNGVKNFVLHDGYFKTSQAYIGTTATWSATTYVSNSTVSLNRNEGSPVVYPEVVEYYGDDSTNIGKTRYVYDNGGYEADIVNMVYFSNGKNYINSKSWKRGKLTATYVYDKDGSLISQSNTTYTVLKSASRHVGTLITPNRVWYAGMGQGVGGISYCNNEFDESVDMNHYYYAYYEQSSGVVVPSVTAETTYQQGDTTRSFVATTTHAYDTAYVLPILQTSTAGIAGQEVVVKTRYATSYTIPGSVSGVAKGIKMLRDKNMLTVPVEQYTLRQSTGGANQRVVSGKIATFKENPNNTSYVQPDEIFLIETTSPITNLTESSLTSSDLTKDTRYKPRIKFTSYSGKGNLTELTKTGGRPIAYIWDYSESRPVAEVANASVGDVAYTSFENGLGSWQGSPRAEVSPDAIMGSKIWKVQPQQQENLTRSELSSSKTYILSYWYKPGAGSISVTGGTQGTPTTFTGKNGWIRSSRTITGATQVIVGNSSGQIDELRLHPIDAQMTTYTYDPVIGITGMADPSSSVMVYEYDPFGRLMTIRDTLGNILKTFQYFYSGKL